MVKKLLLSLGLVLSIYSNSWANEFQLLGKKSNRPIGVYPPRAPASEVASEFNSNCYDGKKLLPIDNQQVLNWKETTRSNYKARAHIKGIISEVYPDRNDHRHFAIKIGPSNEHTIEVVYNIEFGNLPALANGMEVVACGDYITSTQQNGQYPPSPDGAIIHWVHRSPNLKRHDHGFVILDGTLYGGGSGRR